MKASKGLFWGHFPLLSPVSVVCPFALGEGLKVSSNLSYFSYSTPAFVVLLACPCWRHSWWDGCRYVLWLEVLGNLIHNLYLHTTINSLWKVWLIFLYCSLWQMLPFPDTSSGMEIAVRHLLCLRKGALLYLGFSVFSPLPGWQQLQQQTMIL